MKASELQAAHAEFLRLLIALRWCAVAGQGVAVWLAIGVLALPLPLLPLAAAVVLLGIANGVLMAVGRRQPAGAALAIVHLGVDITQLSVVIALSGGAMNPFVSLLLVPIALATLALDVRAILLVAAMATLGYGLSAWLAPPLPHVHGIAGTFDLHLWGMAANFLVTAAVFVVLLTRLAAARARRERELAELRERHARAQGILGLATHAAAMAHALNTPLGTLTLILDDLAEDRALDADWHDEIERARLAVGSCREHVRQLVAEARAEGERHAPVGEHLARVVERWSLLRPAIRLSATFALPDEPVRVDPALDHALIALLDNAADASAAAGHEEVSLALRVDDDVLLGRIVDHGGRPPAGQLPSARLYASDKPGGLGLGLALSAAAIEAHGGEVDWQAGEQGVLTHFRLPLAALRVRPEAPNT
jgi:two-component system sensor histidine kinase RegB